MKKIKSISLSMATVLMVTTAFSASAVAQPTGFNAESSGEISALSSADNSPSAGTDGEQCKEFEISDEIGQTASGTGTAELQNVQQAIAEDRIRLQADDGQVRWEESEIISLEEGDSIVTVPLDTPGQGRSNVAVTLDKDGNIISYSEAHIQSISDEEGHVSRWVDGNLEIDQTYNANDPQLQRGIGEIYGRLQNCLGAHNVPSWLSAAILVGCSFTGGIASLTACLVGFGLMGGVAGWCAGYAIRGTGNEYE